MKVTPHRRSTLTLLALASVWACEQAEQVRDRFRDMTPYETYRASLEASGLDSSALGHDWIEAGRSALDRPVEVALPFQEEGFITPERPGAMAYRVSVGRGQRLTVDVGLATDEGTRVFVDLFRVAQDTADPARPVLSTDSVPGHFEHTPSREGDFIVRLQPELLRGGRYHVRLRVEAQLAMPVLGATTTRSILSVFGADRDAGRRTHEGLDIYARRGTPALAAIDGTVYRVETTPVGGNVVWLRSQEDRSVRLYYAHLDSQAVHNGQEVHVGDTVGFVGNTGNARTTVTHLHFGVYLRRRGAVDPLPYVTTPRGRLADVTADIDRLGSWVRLRNGGIHLRGAPSSRAGVIQEMGQYTPLRVLAASADWYRVRLPDGEEGYVAARLTEPADDPLSSQVASAGEAMRVRPDVTAPVIQTLVDGEEVPVLGKYNGYLYVRSPDGISGWLGAEGP